jgi:hypothetical protein
MLDAGCVGEGSGDWAVDTRKILSRIQHPASSIQKKVFNNRITFSFKSD